MRKYELAPRQVYFDKEVYIIWYVTSYIIHISAGEPPGRSDFEIKKFNTEKEANDFIIMRKLEE